MVEDFDISDDPFQNFFSNWTCYAKLHRVANQIKTKDRTTSDEGNVVSSPRIILHHFVRLGFRRALLRAGFGMEPVATSDSGLERCAGYKFRHESPEKKGKSR